MRVFAVQHSRGPLHREWQRKGFSICIPALEVGPPATAPPPEMGAYVGWLTWLALAISCCWPNQLAHMCRDVHAVCQEWGSGFWEDKPSLLAKFPGDADQCFHGIIWSVVVRRSQWKNVCAMTSQMCARLLSICVRLQKCLGDVLLFLFWLWW